MILLLYVLLFESLLHVGGSFVAIIVAQGRGLVEFDHPHTHVHVLFDQDGAATNRDQGRQIPDTSTDWTIFYRHLLQRRSVVYGREL